MKERESSDSKEISKIRLIKDDDHTMKFTLEYPDEEPEEVLEAFYTTNYEFLEDRNSYLRISKDKIHIFNSEGDHMLTYKNLAF